MRRPRLALTGLRRLLPMVAAALLLPMPPRRQPKPFRSYPPVSISRVSFGEPA